MTKDEFFVRLDARLSHPAKAAEIERQLWDEAGATRAILVSDMSGFTRLTRANGVIEFLYLFRRAVHAAKPLFEKKACFWKTAADNLMASFERVEDALVIARQLAALDIEPSRLCLGLGYGRILQLDDDVFGDEVNVAYKLGEDIATRGEILVSQAAAQQIGTAGLEGPLSVELGGADLKYYRALG